MIRLPRLLAVTLLIACLAGCGNKGDLIKPSAAAQTAPAQS